MLSKTILLIAALSLTTLSTAFKFQQAAGDSLNTVFKETADEPARRSCTRAKTGPVDGKLFWAGTGCQTEGARQDQAMKVIAGDGDSALVVAFFTGNDCNPDNLITTLDEMSLLDNSERGCWEGTYGSFEVWSVCEDGGLTCI
jgi:hypothetical protein